MAEIIAAQLEPRVEELRTQYHRNGPINYFAIDDVLPVEIANKIRAAFPNGETMKVKSSLRELKFIAAQMDEYDSLLEEAIFAFQDERIVKLIGQITGLPSLEPDEKLYVGGISMMVKNHFLNPHVDNSHDIARERYRVLNLLYYVSPDWKLANGGNLELWPDGPQGKSIPIESSFNRLVVMLTHEKSWHSVSKVLVDSKRCCVSNYYFSKTAPQSANYFHVTSFRGRPEQKLRDLILRADIALRMGIRKIFPKGIVKNPHFYDKKD